MTGTSSWYTTELGRDLPHRLKTLDYQLAVPTCDEALEARTPVEVRYV